MSENWHPLDDKGFLSYSVSDHGNVMNDYTGAMITPYVNTTGIYQVGLYSQGVRRRLSLARLVAEYYVPNPEPWISNTLINKDGDRSNCAAHNLAWRPKWFAFAYHKQFTTDRHMEWFEPGFQMCDDGRVYASYADAAIAHGLLAKDIYNALHYSTPVPMGKDLSIRYV